MSTHLYPTAFCVGLEEELAVYGISELHEYLQTSRQTLQVLEQLPLKDDVIHVPLIVLVCGGCWLLHSQPSRIHAFLGKPGNSRRAGP
jgi:hypothetical protein